MFMDSNRNHLDPKLLWENLTLVPAGCIPELCTQLKKYDVTKFDIVIIHVGVNDIDTNSGTNVAKRLIKLTSEIKNLAPGIQIILSEITPRQLNRDCEVLACNTELNNTLKIAENITLVRHSNLRNGEWSHHKKNDDKHFTEGSTARLAGNLKNAFRRAIGAKTKSPRKQDNRRKDRGGNGAGKSIKELLRQELFRLFKD